MMILFTTPTSRGPKLRLAPASLMLLAIVASTAALIFLPGDLGRRAVSFTIAALAILGAFSMILYGRPPLAGLVLLVVVVASTVALISLPGDLGRRVVSFTIAALAILGAFSILMYSAGLVYFSDRASALDLAGVIADTSEAREKSCYDYFAKAEMLLDMVLEPADAGSAILNLAELYERRLRKDPRHARRWLTVQVCWILYGRGLDLLGRFVRARAGK